MHARFSQNGSLTVWPPHAFAFNIGGGKFWNSFGSPTYDPIRQSLFGSNKPAPVTPAAVPQPAAPISAASAEVVQAQQDLRRQALKKRGFLQTNKAGDTGGWMPGPGPMHSPATAHPTLGT